MHFHPDGYYFIHVVFWGVMVLVAVGTTAVANILVAGLVLLFLWVHRECAGGFVAAAIVACAPALPIRAPARGPAGLPARARAGSPCPRWRPRCT